MAKTEKTREDDEPKTAEAEEQEESERKAAKKAADKVSQDDAASRYEKAKKHLVLSCAAIAGGLAVAGTLDRSTGGVLLLIGWLLAVASLHRLGRAGSEKRPEKPA